MVDPVLTAALSQPVITFFGAIKIQLPSGTIRLLDGAGVIVIGGETYTGEDPNFGTINSIDQIAENIGDEAPELILSLYPKDGAAAATLASPAMQGSLVTVLFGALDTATGLPIGTPEVVFLGEIDIPTLSSETNSRSVEFTIVSVFERMFENEEGIRASDGYHQSIWPGELGLQYMTGTGGKLYWATNKPAGTYSPNGGSYGGGRGFEFQDNVREQ